MKRIERSRAVTSETRIEVRYAETDQMGVVHHAVYPVWFELARTRLCAASGTTYAELEEAGHLLMVTGVEISLRRPARYGETVTVVCWIERSGSRGLTFAYEVEGDAGRLAAGRTTHVWVDRESRRPTTAPAPVREAFERLARGEEVLHAG